MVYKHSTTLLYNAFYLKVPQTQAKIQKHCKFSVSKNPVVPDTAMHWNRFELAPVLRVQSKNRQVPSAARR